MSALTNWSTQFAQAAGALPGHGAPWMAATRQRAMDRFMAEGWPTPKNENWRHTSLAQLARQEFVPAPPGATAEIATLREGKPGHWLVFVDGVYSEALSSPADLPAGVSIRPLADVLATDAELVQPYLSDEGEGESPVALNLALASDGAYVSVASGVALEVPVYLVFIAASAQSANFPRNVVVLQENAQATLIEYYIGQGGTTFTNTALTGTLGRRAHLTHLKVQQEHHDAFHLGSSSMKQEEGAVYHSHSMSFGAKLARHDIVTAFNGRHCETLLNGLYYIDGRRHVDHHTRIDHAQPDGVSHEYYRGILEDSAHGVFTGRIHVHKGADRTDAIQRSDSLLLSRLARADARPELEIYADDVKCAHGATIGQLDETSLFYLRSRGLSHDHAYAILTYAFAAAAVERISHQPVRAHVIESIQKLLPAGHMLGEIA